MYIKAILKNMTSRYGKFHYEIGKEYWIAKDAKLKICETGFHFSDNLKDTLRYYDIKTSRYFEIEPLGKIVKDTYKYCSEGIKIIREIPFNELVELDKDGKCCYYFARDIEGIDIPLLQEAVIEKDIDGENCYRFARDIEGVDIPLLQEAIIEKDIDGENCYRFARDIKGANIKKLQQTIIDKDIDGYWCYLFALDIEGVDIPLLQEAIIEKDIDGRWCYYFARDIEGVDIKLLHQKVVEKDKNKNGKWKFRNVWNKININDIENKNK